MQGGERVHVADSLLSNEWLQGLAARSWELHMRARLRARRARDRVCAGQVKLLRQRFEDALGAEVAKMIDISTIDGFQVRCLQAAEAQQGIALPQHFFASHFARMWTLSRMPDFSSCSSAGGMAHVRSAAKQDRGNPLVTWPGP
jgi:hypothetical protein